MSENDKPKPGKTKTETSIRDLQKDEVDSVSGGAAKPPPGWTDPDPHPVQDPKSPNWVDPDPAPVR